MTLIMTLISDVDFDPDLDLKKYLTKDFDFDQLTRNHRKTPATVTLKLRVIKSARLQVITSGVRIPHLDHASVGHPSNVSIRSAVRGLDGRPWGASIS